MKTKTKSWDLPTKHGYTFANTKNIRKASRILTNSSTDQNINRVLVWIGEDEIEEV